MNYMYSHSNRILWNNFGIKVDIWFIDQPKIKNVYEKNRKL